MTEITEVLRLLAESRATVKAASENDDFDKEQLILAADKLDYAAELIMTYSGKTVEKRKAWNKYCAMAETLEKLAPIERAVLKNLYGIGTEKKTHEELSEQMGMSYDSIALIEADALRNMRRLGLTL